MIGRAFRLLTLLDRIHPGAIMAIRGLNMKGMNSARAGGWPEFRLADAGVS